MLAWEHPFDQPSTTTGGSYQLANGLFAQADGGLLGVGFDQSISLGALLPVADSDSIYAVIVNEVGLVGAIGLLVTYLLFVARGLKIATLARDSFSKLLATGLSFIIAMQVFVIVGGVTAVIPLTGVTLPVRRLRRLLGGDELRPAGAALAGLGPGAAPGLRAGERDQWRTPPRPRGSARRSSREGGGRSRSRWRLVG